MELKDRTGIRYGRLTALSRVPFKKKVVWLCQCDCGKQIEAIGSCLGKGTNSCGCLRADRVRKALVTHGMSYTVEYHAFKAARDRCRSPKNHAYMNYGGRGIKFMYPDVETFIADIGMKPSSKHSLDRINVDGNYEPGNCRWATAKEQNVNRRCLMVYEPQLVRLFGDLEGKKIWNIIKQDSKLPRSL